MTSSNRNRRLAVLLLLFYFLLSPFYFSVQAAADPAEVGRVFAEGTEQALQSLKLMDEVKRLADIGRAEQAEALIHQVLKRCPLHPEALDAVDLMIARILSDRSVPDEDRVAAVRQACALGVRTAQAWVDHHKQGEAAARADRKRIDYEFRMTDGSNEACERLAGELVGFLKRRPKSRFARAVRNKLAKVYMDTGDFARAIEVYEEVMKTGGQVSAGLLGRCYYETGDFAKALSYLDGEGHSGRPRGGGMWRDLLARAHFQQGNAARGMKLVGAGALVRKSNVFVHVENDWHEIPRYRRVDRALELPTGAEWVVDVVWQLRASYTCAGHNLVDGQVVKAKVNMVLRAEPISVPKGRTDYALSVVTPVELESTVPYGAVVSQANGYRTTWPGVLVTTTDDWVSTPRVWAESRRGVLKSPPCRVWRTCRILDDNRVQVDIHLSSSGNDLVIIDNQKALIEKTLLLPKGAEILKNRTIRMEIQPSADGLADARPDTPVCSYLARCFQNVKTYLPTVTIIHRVSIPGATTDLPAARNWRWDVGGHVLELDSSRPVWVRKITTSPTFRYLLTEIIEVAP